MSRETPSSLRHIQGNPDAAESGILKGKRREPRVPEPISHAEEDGKPYPPRIPRTKHTLEKGEGSKDVIRLAKAREAAK